MKKQFCYKYRGESMAISGVLTPEVYESAIIAVGGEGTKVQCNSAFWKGY